MVVVVAMLVVVAANKVVVVAVVVTGCLLDSAMAAEAFTFKAAGERVFSIWAHFLSKSCALDRIRLAFDLPTFVIPGCPVCVLFNSVPGCFAEEAFVVVLFDVAVSAFAEEASVVVLFDGTVPSACVREAP
jgi:hypothetical protein